MTVLNRVFQASRTPHGVRGLKLTKIVAFYGLNGRTPHGVRGLKFVHSKADYPVWRSRTPHGVRGLKFADLDDPRWDFRRTPHGVRGLKLKNFSVGLSPIHVAPRTGCVD